MRISGKVTDKITGVGIPYATVELTDKNGVYIGSSVTTDVFGNYSMDSPVLQPGTFMRVSHVSYLSASYPFEIYQYASNFNLSPKVVTLDEIVITAPKTGKQSNAILYGVGALALLYFLTMKKH